MRSYLIASGHIAEGSRRHQLGPFHERRSLFRSASKSVVTATAAERKAVLLNALVVVLWVCRSAGPAVSVANLGPDGGAGRESRAKGRYSLRMQSARKVWLSADKAVGQQDLLQHTIKLLECVGS